MCKKSVVIFLIRVGGIWLSLVDVLSLRSSRLRSLPATSCRLFEKLLRQLAIFTRSLRFKSRIIVIKTFMIFNQLILENFGSAGFEPATSSSRTKRATNCATARLKIMKDFSKKLKKFQQHFRKNKAHHEDGLERERRGLNPRSSA